MTDHPVSRFATATPPKEGNGTTAIRAERRAVSSNSRLMFHGSADRPKSRQMIPEFFTPQDGWLDQVGRIYVLLHTVEQSPALRQVELRRKNRIGAVHSSTAINLVITRRCGNHSSRISTAHRLSPTCWASSRRPWRTTRPMSG